MQCRRFTAVVYAFISASVIIGSSVFTPTNVMADAGPSTETAQTDTTLQEIGATSSPQQAAVVEPTVEQVVSAAPNTTSATTIDTSATQLSTSGSIEAAQIDTTGDLETGQSDNAVDISNIAQTTALLGSGAVVAITNSPTESGDIMLDSATPSATILTATPQLQGNDIVVDVSTTITNHIVTTSTTGSVVATNNDDIGAIHTGDATASVNILNMANTIIGAGDIYVGTITIFGDLHNDIVLSQALLNDLFQTAAPMSTPYTSDVTLSNQMTMTNNIQAEAKSGSILAEKNDSVGALTTGDAQTFIVLKNSSGNYVLYSNALVIIVNVLGEWSGSILGNSPGVSSAVITDGLPLLSSGLPATSLVSSLGKLAITNATTFYNDIKAYATSGDVTVHNNDTVGAITTGAARVSITIQNIANTIVSFGSKLGVLFITIFGDWNGSVIAEQTIVNENSSEPASTAPAINLSPLQPPAKVVGGIPSVQFGSTFYAPIMQSEPPQSQNENTRITEQFTDVLNTISPEQSLLWLTIVALFSGGLFAANRLYAARYSSSI